MLIKSLGLKPYEEVWSLQRSLVEQRARGAARDTLLLCEYESVYTRGQSSKAFVPPSLPHPLHAVERGGDITYHGPGQLVGYPILKLEDHGLRPRSYLRVLEEVLILGLRPLGVEAKTLRGFTGLWCGGKKICSIGVAVKEGVSYHGFAVNVSCDLSPFRSIHPCNLEPDQMTTLQAVLQRPVQPDELVEPLSKAFLEHFAAVAA